MLGEIANTLDGEATGRGSVWRRWDPHIHAPGTLFNDQFAGDDPWEEYLASIETSEPRIEAIGVTDYYGTETYRKLLEYKGNGRLPDVGLLFPNIELRLDIATVSGNWANIHLLVSPEDSDHLKEAERFLSRLTFESPVGKYACTPDDLTLLGFKLDPKISDAKAALRYGASQFKVNLAQLRDEFRADGWHKTNILIAVAGSKTDGTSGVREAGDTTLRQSIERFAHIIFASSVAQREFWLGRRADKPEEIRERYGSLKPCLHGCDAHDNDKVGKPEGDRFSWVKGAPVFDALRQAGIDPASRAYVGAVPPSGASPSQVIREVRIQDAPWAKTPVIPLNRGLVAIIGARGSGKTALADLIAAGADALPIPSDAERPSASFLARAGDLLDGASVALDWGSGDSVTRGLTGAKPSFNHPAPPVVPTQNSLKAWLVTTSVDCNQPSSRACRVRLGRPTLIFPAASGPTARPTLVLSCLCDRGPNVALLEATRRPLLAHSSQMRCNSPS